MNQQLRAAMAAFGLPENSTVKELSGGHINRTYHVVCSGTTAHGWVLQRLNGYVFRRPEQVMENIVRVTEHLRRKGGEAVTLRFEPTAEGGWFFRDDAGNVWRMCGFVPSKTMESGADTAVVEGAGEAYGTFQGMLSDFPVAVLHETIVGFHDTPRRYADLIQAAKANQAGRGAAVQEELAWLLSVQEEACHLCRMREQGLLPLRVTHNDTKLSNVLFDSVTHRPLMVIDLDTVMPGLVAYDFGDAVRTAANTAAEDEPDGSLARLDLSRFQAFAAGFLRYTVGALTEVERNTLAQGCFAVTVEQAVRFLEDYLRGDVYYRTNRVNHNLVRARCQIALAKDMLRLETTMQRVVSAYAQQR